MVKQFLFLSLLLTACESLGAQASEEQLARWLQKYPSADLNRDGRLTVEEAKAYRKEAQSGAKRDQPAVQRGVRREFKVDPGWDAKRFPEHALCYQTPEEIKAAYGKRLGTGKDPVTSFPKPTNGAQRVVGTGHSFMARLQDPSPHLSRGWVRTAPASPHRRRNDR